MPLPEGYEEALESVKRMAKLMAKTKDDYFKSVYPPDGIPRFEHFKIEYVKPNEAEERPDED